MNPPDLQAHLLRRSGLRIDDYTAAYLHQRLQAGATQIPLMARNARTGIPTRRVFQLNGEPDFGELSPTGTGNWELQ